MEQVYRRDRVRQIRKIRRKFVTRVYLLAIIFSGLGLLQWFLFCYFDRPRQIFMDHYHISIVSFGLALILVTLFAFFEKLRFVHTVNVAITIVIVESVIIGVAGLAVWTDWKYLLTCFFTVAFIVAAFILIGVILSHDLTLDVVLLFVLAFIFFTGTVFFIMMFIVSFAKFSFFVYAGFICVIILLFVMYHAQTIGGGRFAEMRTSDYLLAALIIFHDFVIIFMLTFYTIQYYHIGPRYVTVVHSSTTTTTTTTTTAILTTNDTIFNSTIDNSSIPTTSLTTLPTTTLPPVVPITTTEAP